MKTGALHRADSCLVPRARAALRWWQRLQGLLFRKRLANDGSEALLISPCSSIHTIGMVYPLDVVFLDGSGAVLSVREHLRPWRACMQRGAKSVLEFHAGAVQQLRIQPGDVIEWR